jgi:hypothetical protein
MPLITTAHTHAPRPVTLSVGGADWLFSIVGVKRLGRSVFVRVAISGPDVCTLTFHLRDQLVPGSTARRMLTAACEWLLARGTGNQGFIELDTPSDGPFHPAVPAGIM